MSVSDDGDAPTPARGTGLPAGDAESRASAAGQGAPRWAFVVLVVVLWIAGGWGAGIACLRGGYQGGLHGADYGQWAAPPALTWAVIGIGALALLALTSLGCDRMLSRGAGQATTAAAMAGLAVLAVVFGLAAIASMAPLRSALALPADWMTPGAPWSGDLWAYAPAAGVQLLAILALAATMLMRGLRRTSRVTLAVGAGLFVAGWLAIAALYPLALT